MDFRHTEIGSGVSLENPNPVVSHPWGVAAAGRCKFRKTSLRRDPDAIR